MLKIASRLCGLHAQVLSSAELTVWARMDGLERGAVQRALWEQRTLVKTWAMRGTLHLLPSNELPMWHAVLGTSPRYLQDHLWQKYYGINLQQLDVFSDVIAAALSGRVMTKEELIEELSRESSTATFATIIRESSWGTVLKPAAFTGRLCFGPSVGPRVRFTHPITWLSAVKPSRYSSKDVPTAIAEVTRRYLGVYGPATYRDLARWFGGGGIALARRWIQALGDEVAMVDLDGTKAWMLAKHARELQKCKPERSVRLLPGFDQYVVTASCHAENLLPDGLRARVYRPQGWLSPVLLVNGRMEGTWRHAVKGSRVEVAITPFERAAKWVRGAAEEEAERLANYLDCKLSVLWR